MMTMDGSKLEPQSGVVGVVGGGGSGLMGANVNHSIGTATSTTNNNQSPQTGQQLCAGCGKHIQDRFLLRALDALWHEDCLKCGCCDCRLGEVGSTLYTKGNLLLCKRDYLRLFGSTGFCAACNKVIPAFEMVMRARSNVYHLECFACQQCNHRFCVGDRFYLCENKILCEYDYEERLVFASMANHPMLKRQANNLSTPGAGSLHAQNQTSPGQHGIIPGHHSGIHSPVNGHRTTPQGDLNNNSSHSNNHNGTVPPFGSISSKPSACNQNSMGATS